VDSQAEASNRSPHEFELSGFLASSSDGREHLYKMLKKKPFICSFRAESKYSEFRDY